MTLTDTPVMHDETGDGDLVRRFVQGADVEAFADLVRRHGGMVFGVCRRVLQNDADSEDAFQAVFLVLFKRAAAIAPPERVGSWLHGVAYRTAMKAKTARQRMIRRETAAAVRDETGPSTEAATREAAAMVDGALARMPEKYRRVIVLCDLEGRSGSEAAHELGCPEGTVAGRLSRGRALLREVLGRRGVGVTAGVLAALLLQETARAGVAGTQGVSAAVIEATIHGARMLASGKAAAMTEVFSAKVASLTNGVLKTMVIAKLKILAAVVVAATVLGAAGVQLAVRADAPAQSPSVSNVPAADPAKKAAELTVLNNGPQEDLRVVNVARSTNNAAQDDAAKQAAERAALVKEAAEKQAAAAHQ